MSDESPTTPPIRLKPRIRPAVSAVPAVGALPGAPVGGPPPGSPPSVAGAEGVGGVPKFSFTPSLPVATEAGALATTAEASSSPWITPAPGVAPAPLAHDLRVFTEPVPLPDTSAPFAVPALGTAPPIRLRGRPGEVDIGETLARGDNTSVEPSSSESWIPKGPAPSEPASPIPTSTGLERGLVHIKPAASLPTSSDLPSIVEVPAIKFRPKEVKAPSEVSGPPVGGANPPPLPSAARQAPAVSPVMAPPKGGKGKAAVPHVSIDTELVEVVVPTPKLAVDLAAKSKRLITWLFLGLSFATCAGVYFAVQFFLHVSPETAKAKQGQAVAPGPAVIPAKAPVAPAVANASGAAPVGPAPAATVPAVVGTATPGVVPVPSLVNPIAPSPAKAINKAKDVVGLAQSSGPGQLEESAAADRSANKPAVPVPAGVPKEAPPMVKTAAGATTLGRGVAASSQVEAVATASPAFLAFIANSKISGVFQGIPSRAFINGRMVRAGETVDVTLAILFERVDGDRRQLIFRDKTGATVSRKY